MALSSSGRIAGSAGCPVGEWRSVAEPTPVGNVVDRRMALAREWDDLVAQVRKLEGFEDFLMPPSWRPCFRRRSVGRW